MIRFARIVRNVEFAQPFGTFFITAITTILAGGHFTPDD
jgi:hypothetical protein